VDLIPNTVAQEPTQAAEAPDLAQLAREGRMPLVNLMAYVEQLSTEGHVQAACNLYSLWLAGSSDPRRHLVYFNFGALLQSQGQTVEAVAAYQASLSLNPQFSQASINLGLSFERLGQVEQAMQAWSQVVAQRFMDDSPTVEFQTLALNHMGRLHEEHRRYEQAEQVLEESLRLNPKQPGVIQHWVHIRQKACQWPVYKELPGISLGEMVRYTSPLAMLALSDNPVQQLLTAQSFVARTYSLKEERLCEGRQYQHAKLRIGYVSADLREHAVGFLLPAFFEGHATQRYELYAYDYTKEENTATRQQLIAMFKQVRPIHALSDRQAAQLILEDEIDILVDLHGLSSGARPGIFALHPAPKQGTYLGFIGSTGMPWFDFVLADRHVLPPELAVHFTEKPIYIDGTFLPQAASPDQLPQVSRAELGLADDAFVMGAFGNVYKITPSMFACWMKLLQRIPQAVVWLIDDNPQTTANLRAQAVRAGVDPARLVFAARTDHVHFCARLRLADVFLDSYPYNCGSTARDIVNAGVPLVSLYGDTMVSRMGLSILQSVGCPQNAVRTFADYEDAVLGVFLKKGSSNKHVYEAPKEAALMHKALAQLDGADAVDTTASPLRKKSLSATGVSATPEALAPAADEWAGLRVYQWGDADQVNAPFMPLESQVHLGPVSMHAAVRQFLLSNTLLEHVFYGFFPQNWTEECGLSHHALSAFASQGGGDVLTVSPCWDLSCLHLNPFVLAEAAHPGVLPAAQAFCQSIGLPVDLSRCVMHSHNTVFGHSLLAKKRFWLRWLEMSEQLASLAKQPGTPIYDLLQVPANLEGREVSVKEVLQSLLLDLLLLQGGWSVKTYPVFELKPSAPSSAGLEAQAVMANALKHMHAASGEARYLAQFEQLQHGLRGQGLLPETRNF
jgi:predicted O-linked N-acetylglucosamine transferase (SPINDLY family)